MIPPTIKKIVLIGALAGIIFLWYMAWRTAKNNPPAQNPPAAENANADLNANIDASTPSDFVKTGTVTFNTPGLKPDTIYFEFEEPGAPALSKELVFDKDSVCVSQQDLPTPCNQLNTTPGLQYNEHRTTVEGVSRADGSLLVRRIGFAQ